MSYSPIVGLARFELATSRLSGVRSNQLSYRPAVAAVCQKSGGLPTKPAARVAPSRLNNRRTSNDPVPTCRTPPCQNCRSRFAAIAGGYCLTVASDRAVSPRALVLLGKEVIQPQVPLQLPCYDFTPVAIQTLGAYLHKGWKRRLLVQTTPMV